MKERMPVDVLFEIFLKTIEPNAFEAYKALKRDLSRWPGIMEICWTNDPKGFEVQYKKDMVDGSVIPDEWQGFPIKKLALLSFHEMNEQRVRNWGK